jgi:hypothetical protein
MRTVLVVLAMLAVACEPDAPSPDRTSAVTATAKPSGPTATAAAVTAKPSGAPSAAAPATSSAPSSSASAAAAEWPGDRTVAQLLASATKVKITELLHEGGKVSTRQAVVTDKKDVEAIVAAIGADQRPTGGCARCMPSLTFGFEDSTGTRLAGVGLFCGEGGVAASIGTIRDGLGDKCHALAIGKPDDLKALGAKHAAAAASGAPSAAPAAASAK